MDFARENGIHTRLGIRPCWSISPANTVIYQACLHFLSLYCLMSVAGEHLTIHPALTAANNNPQCSASYCQCIIRENYASHSLINHHKNTHCCLECHSHHHTAPILLLIGLSWTTAGVLHRRYESGSTSSGPLTIAATQHALLCSQDTAEHLPAAPTENHLSHRAAPTIGLLDTSPLNPAVKPTHEPLIIMLAWII